MLEGVVLASESLISCNDLVCMVFSALFLSLIIVGAQSIRILICSSFNQDYLRNYFALLKHFNWEVATMLGDVSFLKHFYG